MQYFDTIIVGAGPGGLACAATLARHGQDVLILERNSHVGPKVCAGGIPHTGFPPDIPETFIERSFARQHIRSNWQKVTISSTTPIIYTVNRRKLGQWMMEQALQAGAKIETKAHVQEISELYVATKEDRFGYRYLVGADGSSSIIRRYLKINTRRMGTGIHYQIQSNFDKLEWHLDTKLFHNGYSWIFPYQNSASVGAYACHSTCKPKLLLQKLHLWAKKYGIDLNRTKPHAALINYDYQGWRFGNKFLVGDAAGLASGLTGEGIYPAIISGKTVANTIIDKSYDWSSLERLIQKQQMHCKLLELTGKNKTMCKMLLEILVFGLRPGLIPYSALEMGA